MDVEAIGTLIGSVLGSITAAGGIAGILGVKTNKKHKEHKVTTDKEFADLRVELAMVKVRQEEHSTTLFKAIDKIDSKLDKIEAKLEK